MYARGKPGQTAFRHVARSRLSRILLSLCLHGYLFGRSPAFRTGYNATTLPYLVRRWEFGASGGGYAVQGPSRDTRAQKRDLPGYALGSSARRGGRCRRLPLSSASGHVVRGRACSTGALRGPHVRFFAFLSVFGFVDRIMSTGIIIKPFLCPSTP